MALPLPNLDNKTFNTLLDEAVKQIPRHSPQWTDHNRHDPGVTIIELFCWLAEMQQYYLNQVGEAHERKFLKLLGVKPRVAASARTEAVFTYGEYVTREPQLAPQGTKLKTESVTFETEQPLLVAPAELKLILSSTKDGLIIHTDANNAPGLSFYAFGAEADAGSRLYLGFDKLVCAGQPLPPDRPFVLSFDLFEDYPTPRGGHGDEEPQLTPSALVTWEYLNNKDAWAPLDLITELERIVATQAQSQLDNEPLCSAPRQRFIESVKKTRGFPRLPDAARRRLECALDRAKTYGDLRRLLTDAALMRSQGDETLMFSLSGRITFIAPGDMKARGLSGVAGGGQLGAQDPLKQPLYWLRATVQQPGYELPPRIDTILLNVAPIVQCETFSEYAPLTGAGEPNQTFRADSFLALTGNLTVQARERDGSWMDWEFKETLANSGPNDPHYTLYRDPAGEGVEIKFGDGRQGGIPPAGENNIRLIACAPEFAESRLIGAGSGLPNQVFLVDQLPVVPDSFALQVEEPFAEERFTEETLEIRCLLRFTRRAQARLGQAGKFSVEITLEAEQSLCYVTITEEAHGNVTLPAPVVISIEKLRAGEVMKIAPYNATAGAGGGRIGGKLSFRLGRQCEMEEATTPTSTIAVGPLRRAIRWRDWTRVDDFDSSQPSDRHYTLEPEAGEIVFGDGINGCAPPMPAETGEKNIRVIAYQAGGGVVGNVIGDTIKEIVLPGGGPLRARLEALHARNFKTTQGGAARETLEEAQTRARRDLRTGYQGVTSEDIEYLAQQTPGLRVARAKAIPLFEPGATTTVPAAMTVVVLPYSFVAKPVPSPAFLKTVCRHLDRHRLITTRLRVVPPDYMRVSVEATVLLRPGFEVARIRVEIEKKLNNFLRPLPAKDDPQDAGWPFGRAVYRSEIYQLLENITVENIKVVDCVERVALLAEGAGIARDAEGNILITPQSVVYSGVHQIEILTPGAECRA